MSESYLGACPVCEKSDGYMNVGREHFFVCHAHKKKWFAGSNLFSSWREEPTSAHAANAAQLAGYEEVEPYYPEKDQPRAKERPPRSEMSPWEADAAMLASARLLLGGAHADAEVLAQIVSNALGALARPNVDVHDVNLCVGARPKSLQRALQAAATLLHHAGSLQDLLTAPRRRRPLALRHPYQQPSGAPRGQQTAPGRRQNDLELVPHPGPARTDRWEPPAGRS